MIAPPEVGTLRNVHHINCGTFHPTRRTRLITHVLVCEFDEGVVLVDTGLGRDDIAEPWTRLGKGTKPLRPALNPDETAHSQLSALGLVDDVALIIATHLDYDHVGGIADFPDVPVLTTKAEHTAATQRPSLRERMRYKWVHIESLESRVALVDDPGVAQLLPIGLRGYPIDQSESLFAIPMRGHTRGHAAVAVHTPSGWLVHAGDAFFHHSALTGSGTANHGHASARFLRNAEWVLAMDRSAIAANHAALAQIHTTGARVVCSHDPTLL